jgi:aryl-alcohol dehydrogenase-like predicted oxidoreductase
VDLRVTPDCSRGQPLAAADEFSHNASRKEKRMNAVVKTDRRAFIGSCAALACAGCRVDGTEPSTRRAFSAWDRVTLGKTGITTTRLGFGTGVNAANHSSAMIRKHGRDGSVRLLRAAYERGVRFFDAADSYGSHALLSEALAPFPRASYVLCTKWWFKGGGIPAKDRADVATSVDRFLRELKTDYIDIVQLHCVTAGDWPTAMADEKDALARCKAAGKIRAHGCSFHGAASLPVALQDSWLDVAHVQVNPFGRHMGLSPARTLDCVRQLRAAGKGVIGMKILGVGSFAGEGRIDASLAWVLRTAAADILDIGFTDLSEIDDIARRIAAVQP